MVRLGSVVVLVFVALTRSTLGAIPLTPGPSGAVTVQKVSVADCRVVRGFLGTPVDGSEHSRDYRGSVREYPRTASDGVAYSYNGNDGVHITLADSGGFDAIVLRGGAAARAYADVDGLVESAGVEPIATFAGSDDAQTVTFGARQGARRVSLFAVQGGTLADVSFYRVARATPTGARLDLEVVPSGAPEPLPYASEFDEQGPTPALDLRYTEVADTTWLHHSGRPSRDLAAVSAARVLVTVRGAATPTPFAVTVHDPLSPRLDLAHVEFVASAAGAYDITVDFAEQVLLPGSLLWVATRVPAGVDADVAVAFTPTDRASALPEALAWRKLLMRTYFSLLSEPRPWGGYRGQPREEFYSDNRYAAQCPRLFLAIDQCHALAPDDDLVRQYREWVYLRALPELSSIAGPPAPPDGVPDWAWYPRLAWIETRRIAEWWLDERLVETGEFGGRVGDDTDMYQQYVDLPYFESGGVAGPLKAAGAALAELADRENLRGGLNIHATDSLHAYEEGINHLALMSRWFYGDPIYFERCMESARNMEALTIRTADGRRHFRTTVRMGAEDIETPREPNVDGHANPLMWHTALQVADYNRNPEALRLLREWGDTWLRYQNPGEFATAVDVVSGDVVDSYENRPLYGGYSTQASVFTWLYALTGDAKYVEPFTLYYRRGEAPYPSNGYLPDVWALGGMGDLGRETLAPLAGRSAALALYALGDHGPAMARAIGKARASTAQISSLSDAARWPDMYTTAHQFTDRVFPDIQSHASQAYLGGHMRRNRMHPTLAVSWAGFGSDYAALVRENGRDHLRVSVYSYADEPTRGRMTVWALDHGVYDLAAGTDGDSAGGRGTRRVELAKGESVAVTLPPGEATTIELTQVARLDSVFARADLAVAERELRVEDGHVHARIHNIGAAPAADVLVALVDSEGSQVGEPATVSLEAPLDLRPRSVDVKLRLPPTPTHGLRVAIDPANTVPEIYEGNNTAPAPLP